MQTIHKFPFHFTPMAETLAMPAGAQALSVQMQFGVPCLWMLVEDSAPKELRKVWTVGTGGSLADVDGAYVGTFQDGSFVWHIFLQGSIV